MFFALQPIHPAGRELEGEIALFLRKTKTAFFNLSQRELPLLTNCTELFTNSYRHETPGRYHERFYRAQYKSLVTGRPQRTNEVYPEPRHTASSFGMQAKIFKAPTPPIACYFRGITVETSSQYCYSRTSGVGIRIRTLFYGSTSDQSFTISNRNKADSSPSDRRKAR